MSRSAIPKSLRAAVSKRDDGFCQYCGLSQLGQGATFHINHVTPRSKGGATVLENLVLQCPYCSLHKADLITAADPISGEMVRLFDPLREKWLDHFRLQPDGSIAGRTSCGRTTVAALQMNDSIPRLARIFQMALGLFHST